MDLIKCPLCGEMYSSTYPRCPFCEEEDKTEQNTEQMYQGGDQKKALSARGGMILAVLLVLLLLSWYLFGDAIVKLRQQRASDKGIESHTAKAWSSIK